MDGFIASHWPIFLDSPDLDANEQVPALPQSSARAPSSSSGISLYSEEQATQSVTVAAFEQTEIARPALKKTMSSMFGQSSVAGQSAAVGRPVRRFAAEPSFKKRKHSTCVKQCLPIIHL